MRFRKPTHPITADVRREISCFALSKAGGFKRPMRFPFQHIETERDHIRIFTPGNRARPPQIIPVVWQRITYGLKPYLVCPRCHTRRWFLYFDGLQAYCRKCADLRFLSQRVRRRTRLLHRSHRIRVSLGDQLGKPGDQFPPRPYRQKTRDYQKTIARLRHIERQYLHIIATDRRHVGRERDERGRFIPNETPVGDDTAEELGR